jgi:hypothetical protein
MAADVVKVGAGGEVGSEPAVRECATLVRGKYSEYSEDGDDGGDMYVYDEGRAVAGQMKMTVKMTVKMGACVCIACVSVRVCEYTCMCVCAACTRVCVLHMCGCVLCTVYQH